MIEINLVGEWGIGKEIRQGVRTRKGEFDEESEGLPGLNLVGNGGVGYENWDEVVGEWRGWLTQRREVRGAGI